MMPLPSCSSAIAALCMLFTVVSLNTSSLIAQPPVQVAEQESLQTKTDRGPVTVEVVVSPKQPRLSDEPTLTLTVTAKDGVRVQMPPFGEALGDFVIRDFYEPIVKTSDGNQIFQQVYTLEPSSAGTVSIDPITVRFVDERPDGDGKEHEIQSEALLVEVQTMISSQAPSLNDLRPVVDPMALDEPLSRTKIALIIAGIVGVVGLAVLLLRLLRPKKKAEPELTPHQLAWREFNNLLSSKLSETDVKEFFVQLTAVVRRYIERTTGINAPDQTTEEFLREINSQKLFAHEDNVRLEAFLESADLVKFAGYQPDVESIKESTHRAKQFIDLKTVSDNSTPSQVEATS